MIQLNKIGVRGFSLALSVSILLACSPTLARDQKLEALQNLAEQENPRALYHLGMMYLTGTSVDKDPQKAVEFFLRAAELGNPLASYKLGCFYDGQYNLFETDHDLALRHKLVAAEAGYALAQQDVALLFYRRGDHDSAMGWLERAVAQGTPGAISTYASIHNGALGIEKDPVKTAAYFQLLLQRSGGSDDQRAWLRDFESKLTAAELERVAAIVEAYDPNPSALTIEALAGNRAVDALIGNSRSSD